VAAWPAAVLGDPELSAEVAAFVERIRPAGWSNSLGQKLLQLAAPGIPDIYQGTELFDLSLVDPDNRRPVDFAERAAVLDRLESGWLPEIDESGTVKLHVVRTVLRLRRDRPELFAGYRPVSAEGVASGHVVAFARDARLVAVATRLPLGLARSGGWGETRLALPGTWVDLLTRTEVSSSRLADVLGRYPVALLLREDR
ncbi:MAG TPA: malto-oligosyltrehalose synthase, partial [Actinophytocola sp.]|nr:malto-oligosyltrehalose synthase [Actinophytocola sp.]